MPTYRTPDVYVEEISVFPPSVAEVETAIPAFIGYTQIATRSKAFDLILKPTLIYSLKEYEQLFGFENPEPIAITVATDATTGALSVTSFTVNGAPPKDTSLLTYLMYYGVKMYFDNGGGKCYIVSVGTYQADGTAISTKISLSGAADDPAHPETSFGLLDGVATVAMEDEPTLIVIPDAANLDAIPYGTLVQAVLLQCGTLKDRFGIFDALQGNVAQDLDPDADGVNIAAAARSAFGMNNLKYGAVYYPFVRTSMNYSVSAAESNVSVTVGGVTGTLASFAATGANPNTAAYNFVKTALGTRYLIMPPSGAVAGVYAWTDTNRGVWKAPANISLADVIEPVIKLDNAHQDTLNIDTVAGKSINAIRSFAGKGTLVWGARTLAGNDNEWRYISVRRFFNMVEESVKKSTYWAVFEGNDANLWVKVRGMIENYLTQKWREGALVGATTKDAFFVKCGLGTTMNAVDILEGRMNVEIGMAVVRPAEFIILKFSHKLQTS